MCRKITHLGLGIKIVSNVCSFRWHFSESTLNANSADVDKSFRSELYQEAIPISIEIRQLCQMIFRAFRS